MTAPRTYSDAYMVRMVEHIIATSNNDHMIGTRTRVLFELLDASSQRWTDTGSGAGHDKDWPYDPRD